MYKKIITKIKNNKIKIGIIGLGYVGLPLIERFIKKKINVYGIDIDFTHFFCIMKFNFFLIYDFIPFFKISFIDIAFKFTGHYFSK